MIDKCKQFNTKEADTLQTTEFSKIPKNILEYTHSLLEIFCKAQLFFNFVKPKFQKKNEFFKIPKLYGFQVFLSKFLNNLGFFLDFPKFLIFQNSKIPNICASW